MKRSSVIMHWNLSNSASSVTRNYDAFSSHILETSSLKGVWNHGDICITPITSNFNKSISELQIVASSRWTSKKYVEFKRTASTRAIMLYTHDSARLHYHCFCFWPDDENSCDITQLKSHMSQSRSRNAPNPSRVLHRPGGAVAPSAARATRSNTVARFPKQTRQTYSKVVHHQLKMPAEPASAEARRRAAREVIDILHEIATLLVCDHLPHKNGCHVKHDTYH
jgi:hypothetical protein